MLLTTSITALGFEVKSSANTFEVYDLVKGDSLTVKSRHITLEGAILLAERARQYAKTLQKNIAVAVVDGGGNTILIHQGNGVGPHNAEAARKKAFTSLSTKTSTLVLERTSKLNPDTENLRTVTALLLLGGGVPLYDGNELIGALGIAGGGGPLDDDRIARKAISALFSTEIKTIK